MDVRPYTPMDRDACLALFESNTPEFFVPHEREEFTEWLDGAPEHYFVLEHDGVVVACGGYVLPGAGQPDAWLAWGMVGRAWQRQGLGRFLLMYRMREIGRAGAIQTVWLDTSPESAPFFASQGFQVVRVIADGYAAGRDKVEMVRKISVCG